MTQPQDTRALIAALSGELAGPGPDDRELLISIVTVARSIFGAAASSIFLFDADRGELVFEAVSGEGEDFLIGTRFPADRGIAGWVLATGEPMTAESLRDNELFSADLAESTGYVPDTIMAAPVVHGDRTLGVLEVLDPASRGRSGVGELDLLMMFAGQAGLSLHGLVRVRAARAALTAHDVELRRLAELGRRLSNLTPDRRDTCVRMLDSLTELAGLLGA
jgi:GAF domain-containing protein